MKGIQIQELLADELALLLMGIFRLAIGALGREVYQKVTGVLAEVLGTDHTLERDARVLDRTLRSVLAAVTAVMKGPPSAGDPRALIDIAIQELGLKRLVRTYRQYESSEFLENVLASLAILLEERASDLDTWEAILDAVEGKDQVRLMTIHKGKGLEFHTVIFLGLHENSFWGFRRNAAEETNAFFVALSSARERVYFTRAREGGNVRTIEALTGLLQSAWVPFIEHDHE